MSKCDSVVILDFKQIEIESCIEKEDRDHKRTGVLLPTAWNHIEAG